MFVTEDVKMSEPTTDVTPESSPETEAENPEEVTPEEPVSEDEKTPAPSVPPKAEETVPYRRFKEVNDELTRLKKQPPKEVNKALDVEDYIDISAALEGLDQREKSFLAREHKLSGKPLSEIRSSEDFLLWQSAYREKVEKDKSSLAPSTTQPDESKPKSLAERLATASLEEKEKILAEQGLWHSPRPKADRTSIGTPRVI